MNISGTWEGQYTYGEAYDDYAGTSVRFAMTLQLGGVAQLIGRPRLTGTIRDSIDDGGQPGLAQLVGRRIGTGMRFVKTMPHSGMDDYTMAELRCEFRAQFHKQPPEPMPKHRIAYNGTISHHGEQLSGSWLILPMLFETDDGPVRFGGIGEGTWTARRSSHLANEI